MRYLATPFLLITSLCFANQTGVAIGDCTVVVNASGQSEVYVNNQCDSKQAAKLQKQLDALAAKLAQRRLTEKQSILLANALKSENPLSIKFFSLKDEEASQYANDIKTALRMSGTQVQWVDIGTFSPPIYGLEITLRTDGIKVKNEALKVQKAFEEAGISFTLKYRSALANDAEIFVGLRPAGPLR